MSKVETYREFRAALREQRLSDAAVLKAELGGGGGARPEVEAELAGLAATFPTVELEPLLELPRGTIGREYAELLTANGLDPFRLTDRIDPAMLERNIFIARYSLLHDVYHVLTGFDTSWGGEAGVWGFVAGQRYRWTFWLAAFAASFFYPLFSPRQAITVWRNVYRGVKMGRRASMLITLPIEQQWDRSVAELRQEYGIEPTNELDIVERPSA